MEFFEVLALVAAIATTWWVTKRYIAKGVTLEKDNTPRRFAFALFDIWLLAGASFIGSAIIAINLPIDPTLRGVIGFAILFGGAFLWKRKTDQVIDNRLTQEKKIPDTKESNEEDPSVP